MLPLAYIFLIYNELQIANGRNVLFDKHKSVV
jgi:hypothetical protein